MLLDLHVALNYGQGTGSVQMLRFVTEHTEVHSFRLVENARAKSYPSDCSSPTVPRLAVQLDLREQLSS